MTRLEILSSIAIGGLKGGLDNNNVRDNYMSGSAPSIDQLETHRTLIEPNGEHPQLVVSEPMNSTRRTAEDAANAIRVHDWLGPLTRQQAADDRLWITLAHREFFGYAHQRWCAGATDKEKAGAKSLVGRHFFTGATGKAKLRTNAISRLWWAAELTRAPWSRDEELAVFKTADDARFTKVMLEYQQIYFDVIERDFGSNLRIRTCLLDALAEGAKSVGAVGDLSGGVAKRLNLIARTRNLDSMGVAALRELCGGIVESVAGNLAAAKAEGVAADAAPA